MINDKNLIEIVQVDGKELAIERQIENCWVNLTQMAKPFGKLPKDWLKQQYVKNYLQSLADKINERKDACPITLKQMSKSPSTPITPEDLIIVRKGNTSKYEQGTWCTDYRIAMRFAQWLDTRFSVEVDTLLVKIVNGELIIGDPEMFHLRGRQWVSIHRYCKLLDKSEHSFYGLKGSYPKYFLYLDARWYMDKELFDMKEVQMRFEDKRRKIRGTDGERQLPSLFPENELNETED